MISPVCIFRMRSRSTDRQVATYIGQCIHVCLATCRHDTCLSICISIQINVYKPLYMISPVSRSTGWQIAILCRSTYTCLPADLIPADLIHANTSLYPYRSLYIQYYIYDKPCMRGRSACWQLYIYKRIHVYLPTCGPAVLIPANLSVYPHRSMYKQYYI